MAGFTREYVWLICLNLCWFVNSPLFLYLHLLGYEFDSLSESLLQDSTPPTSQESAASQATSSISSTTEVLSRDSHANNSKYTRHVSVVHTPLAIHLAVGGGILYKVNLAVFQRELSRIYQVYSISFQVRF